MLDDIKLSQQLKFIAFLIPILWLIFGYLYVTQRVEELTTRKYNEISKEMETELKTLIEEKKEAILLIAMSISSTSQIKETILSQKNKNLQLDKFSLKLKENTSLKNVWFQIISADGISLYRSWTNKVNDDLKKFRPDVLEMLNKPRIISIISTGKFDLSFKSMVPVYDDNKFVGFIEVIAKFNSIALKMQKKNYDIVILVDKSYKEQLTKPFTKNFIDDYYVVNLNAKKDLLKFLRKNTIEHFTMLDKTHHRSSELNKLVRTYHLKDIHDKEMGYFILFKNKKDIDVNEIIKFRDRLILFFLLIFIILSALIYYIYSRKYKNLINVLNQKLSNEITHKTKELQTQSDKLAYIANHDSLTGLPNRLLFLDRLKQSIKHAKRNKSTIGVLFLDLDRFKEINDTYGHAIGDKLLQEVAFKLIDSVREEDTISRLGGDEFTIILENISQEDITKITQNIVHLMQEKIIIEGIDTHTTFSIGISNFPQDGDTPDILLRNADTAMYKAKELGKNQYQFYKQEMTQLIIEKATIEHDLRLAIENNEFEVYYQPKIDALNERLIGVEALIRWNHPTLSLLSPATFIHIAEDTGLIIELDRWMMLNATQTIKEWQDDGLDTGKLSLNLSIKQLETDECIEKLKSTIDLVGINTRYLELELSEGQVMKDPKSSIKVLTQIRELGISISIDDFGTGYSSLSYLKRLPIDKLKIDQSFVSDLPHDKDDAAIIESIIALAKSLNLELIAEGVETKEQLDFLVDKDCHNIQGYYFSKPLPASEYKAFILKYQ